jgi:hypothetical protein
VMWAFYVVKNKRLARSESMAQRTSIIK